MKKYLVIGNPIEHSLSPPIHNYWMKKYRLVDSVYEKEKVEEKDLKKIIEKIRNDQITGANVTVPFKKLIIPYVDELDEIARDVQSVNTLHKIGNKIIGYNTDCSGFLRTIMDYYGFLIPEEAVDEPRRDFFILGAGGVTSSIIASLKFLLGSSGVIWLSNRTKKNAIQLKKLFPKIELIDWGELPPFPCDVVVNTTSVGLKKNDNLNIDFTNIDKKTLFYDLIYNPKETNFLRDARLRGNKTMNGQMMFLEQAKESFRIWTDVTPEIDDEVIKLLNND
tara:strand:+ start:132 stop:968 length:837 start_codon:yes stop_codon:yes gene_type:complete